MKISVPDPLEVNVRPVAATFLACMTAQALIAHNPYRERVGLRAHGAGLRPACTGPATGK